jgi:acetyl esterase/lipase
LGPFWVVILVALVFLDYTGTNMKLFFAIILGLCLIAGSYYVYTKSTTVTPTWADVSYSSVSATNVLDVYLPENTPADVKLPTVVWIHGGAFKMGDKSSPQSLSRLLSEGYAVVSINYRLSSEAIWPAQKEDLENVLQFIQEQGQEYNLDKNRIAFWGASAGGYLASMAGVALDGGSDTDIKAVVDWFGPVSFYHMDSDIESTGVARKTGNNGDADSPESVLLGVAVKENEAASYAASPLAYIEQSDSIPPFLIMHGASDPMIGAPQSERLYNAIISKFGTSSAEYHLLPNGTHGGGDFTTTEAEDIVINFLKAHL